MVPFPSFGEHSSVVLPFAPFPHLHSNAKEGVVKSLAASGLDFAFAIRVQDFGISLCG